MRKALLVELITLTNFVCLGLALFFIPKLQLSESSLIALYFHGFMSVIIAFIYGLFVVNQKPPIAMWVWRLVSSQTKQPTKQPQL